MSLETMELPPHSGINYFRIAREQSLMSRFRCKVGACLVSGKSVFKGYNKRKTHTRFANPNLHIKTSLHAELSCIINAGDKVNLRGSSIYVYRETSDGSPAMSKPCSHCMKFLKEEGISNIYYSKPEYPYWDTEKIN